MSNARVRNNVTLAGRPDGPPMVFAHGFGCDQRVWRRVAPAFAEAHQIVLFDHVGAGGSDRAAYDRERYASLQGYADDVLEIIRELALPPVIFVGHSVSAMIGVLAAIQAPEYFESLVLIGPSPRYIDDGDYVGGFTEQDVEELLEQLDSNYLGWSAAMAPAIMANPDRPELGQELVDGFCRTDPEIARHFAGVTFRSDNRAELCQLTTRALILQCADDVLAPRSVGEYVHRHVADGQLAFLHASGHCPHVSAPEETIAVIRPFL
jgi:sigma-B regulation protein RsbQ